MKKTILKNCLLLFLSSFVPLHSFSEDVIRLDTTAINQCITSEVLHSDSHSYTVRIKMHFLRDDVVAVSGMEYHKLSIDGQSLLDNMGEPALPIITKHIGIPVGSSADVRITENQWKNVSVGRIFPYQNYQNTDDGTRFHISESVYRSDQYMPQRVKLSENTVWKGIENLYVSICPFKYYPLQNKISVLTDFTLHVDFAPSRRVVEEPIIYKEQDLSLFDNVDFMETSNINSLHSRNLTDTIPNYLIIVGNIPSVINSQEMADFCKWKALKGYRTKVVSTQVAGTDSASIRNYITQQVANGIEQVLFVGDQTTIPIPSIIPMTVDPRYPRMYSDYWYGCLGGNNDVQADVPIGRFIVESLSDFRNMVQKTIMYESCSYPFSSKALLFANAQHYNPNYLVTLEEIRTATYADTLTYFTAYAAPPEYGGSNASADDVYDYMNDGMNLVTYNGHSNWNNIWLSNEVQLPGHIYYLAAEDTFRINYNRYFVFVSTGCMNGKFMDNASMMRSYVQSNHCAIAYLGDTYPMFTYPANDYLKRFYYRLLNNLDSHLGHLNINTHIDIMGNSNSAITNAFGYICAGDPTLELWTGIQKTFQNVSISLIQDSIVVSVGNANDYNINVANENGVYIGTYTSSSGVCKIPISIGVWDMALNKHDHIPYVVHVDANNNYIQNVTIDDIAYYYGSPLSIGYDVTTSVDYGNVTIEPNAKVYINMGNTVMIKNGFECKIGAELTIE